MTLRTMRPLSFLLPALAALGLWLPNMVAAQAYGSITRVDVQEQPGGPWVEKKVATPVYVNAEECSGTFRFKLAPIASTVSVMEAWVSNTTGSNCVTASSRSRINSNEPACWPAASKSGVSGEFLYEIPGNKIFNRSGGACPTDVNNQIFTVYFIPLASPSSNSGSMAPEAIFNVIKPQAQFTLYTQRPTAPGDIKGENGNHSVALSWDRVGNDLRTRYRAFFDYTWPPPNGRECGSGVLDDRNVKCVVDGGTPAVMDDAGVGLDGGGGDDAGVGDGGTGATGVDPPPPGCPNIKVIDDINGTGARWRDIEQLIEVGQKVQVAVATIDATGNVGQLSAPVCVMRDNSKDLADLCEEEKDCGLGNCSASPGRSGGAVALSAFALAICALLRRRRSA